MSNIVTYEARFNTDDFTRGAQKTMMSFGVDAEKSFGALKNILIF